MSIDHLYPFAGDHAIQNATMVLEWGAEHNAPALSADQLFQISEVARQKLQSEFPKFDEIKLVALQFNQGNIPQGQQFDFGGFKMSKLGPFGVAESRSVTVTRDHCAIQFSDYSRWALVKADFDRYMISLVPAICGHVPIRAVTLQVTDVFTWKANPAELNLAEVFRAGSRWLPAHVFELKDLWHSHHGYFDESEGLDGYKQLDNVNISRARTEISDVLQILMSLRATLSQPCWDKSYDATHVASRVFEKLHDDNKQVLRELLTEEVLQKISML